MPQLDGVSATAMIREVQPNIPIIAMTSNINQTDLDMYYHWGKFESRAQSPLFFEVCLLTDWP